MAEQRPTDQPTPQRPPGDRPLGNEQRPFSAQHQVDPITGTTPVGPLEPADEADAENLAAETPDKAQARRSGWSMAAGWFLLAFLLIFLLIAYYWTRPVGG